MVIVQVRKSGNRVARYKLADIKASKVHPKGRVLGYQVVHCSTKGVLGKPIKATPKPVSLSKAQSIHRAIQWRKHHKEIK